MKTFLTDIDGSGYSFNKAANQVTLTGLDVLELSQVLAIVNTTRGITICDCTMPSLRAVSIAANVITLNYDTSSQNNSDKLLIVLDYAGSANGLTNTELRASAVPVSAAALPLPAGAAIAANQQTDGLTDAELRASAVPVSAAALPLPAGAAIAANQQTDALTDAELRASAVPVSAAALPLPAGAAIAANQQTDALTDTELRASAVPVSAASLPLPAGAATEATLAILATAVHNEDSSMISGDPGIFLLAVRQDADTSAASDGDFTALKLDEDGRLKVSSKPASYPDITGDITAIQATIGTPVAGGTVSGDVSRASNVMVFCSGTFSTINCTFEGSIEASGDTNWFALQAVRSNANTIELATGNLSAQPAYAWELSVNALKRFRVRCTARTSGTQSWRVVQGTYATEPIPAAQASATQPISGALSANQSCNISQMNGVATTMGNGVAGTGVQRVAVASDNTANSNPWLATLVASAAQGSATNHHAISAASTNATSVKASAGTIGCLQVSNLNAAARFLKLYNKASAPTVGTDTPVMTILLPPNSNQFIQVGPYGVRFTTGIAYALTTGISVADTGAVSVSEHSVGIFYT